MIRLPASLLLLLGIFMLGGCSGSSAEVAERRPGQPGTPGPGVFTQLPAFPAGRTSAGLTETLVLGRVTELRSSGVSDNGNAVDLRR